MNDKRLILTRFAIHVYWVSGLWFLFYVTTGIMLQYVVNITNFTKHKHFDSSGLLFVFDRSRLEETV